MENRSLKIENRRTEVVKVEDLLTELNIEFGLKMEKFLNFQIAVSEALVNAIVHGNKEDLNKYVSVDISFTDNSMSVRIKDQGKGFDTGNLPDPTMDENLLKEHGRGVFIIKSLVDKYECTSSSAGTEMILTVYK